MSEDVHTIKNQQGRSPNFPSLSLQQALDKAGVLNSRVGTSDVALDAAVRLWGLKPRTGAANLTVAALKAYGLTETTRKSGEVHIRLTTMGLNLLKRPDGPERNRELKEVALKPTALRKLWAEYGGGPLDDGVAFHFLTVTNDPRFTDGGARQLLRVYRSNLSFANLAGSAILSEGDGDDAPESRETASRLNPESGRPSPSESSPRRPIMQTALAHGAQPSKQFSFDVTEGQCYVQVPAPLSDESIEVFEGWLDLIKKQVQHLKTKPPEAGER